MFLLGNVVQRQRQQEVLGTDEQAASLLVQQQGAEAARALQLEASHAVELLQLCRYAAEKHGFTMANLKIRFCSVIIFLGLFEAIVPE